MYFSWETFLEEGLEAVLGMSNALRASDKEFLTYLQYCRNSEASPEVADSVFGTEELGLVTLEPATSGLPMYLITESLFDKLSHKIFLPKETFHAFLESK